MTRLFLKQNQIWSLLKVIQQQCSLQHWPVFIEKSPLLILKLAYVHMIYIRRFLKKLIEY
ncbi:hypothetical protein BHR43_18920 [Aeromonas salmonicida subsp. salmonicida]|nr:hypothetical protein BHG40_11225 [Aeromonas salmonicida subsp. masoucida]KHE95106.1 hypothetical protein NV17_20905 [Aeromonas salmonicida subsp. salmonicida]KTA91888.1 hypothetical protein VO71_16855 [Aeromonas salmonicida subsp. smithia]ORJ13799.1 hypothetical protein A7D02_21745 [Aeromonas salmonicida]KHE96322.1 hypothetical protein NX85_19425 [Aeromonas salmonicida subsp. salmonicida]